MDRYNEQIIKTYRKRMAVSAITSSVCFGLMIGGGAAFIAALVSWLFSFTGVWVAVGTGLGAAAIAGVLLYFLKFRPTDKQVIRQIDRMGLEERTVTMMDLAGDTSTIAQMQRADAHARLENVNREQVRFAFPAFTIDKYAKIALAVALVLGVGMTTVCGLSAAGAIPSPNLNDPVRDNFILVSYWVEEGGEIEGEADQILSLGEDATPVVAVAEDGWAFLRWSDGNKSTERTDLNVTADLTVTAIFEEISDEGDDEDGDSLDQNTDGDYDQNVPEQNEGGGDGSGSTGGDGSDGNGEGGDGDGGGGGEGGQEGGGKGEGQGDGAGGGWSDSNQIIDGNTNYLDVFEQYYNMAMEILQNGGELPPELKEFIEEYYGSL